jgi:hypothetical protein
MAFPPDYFPGDYFPGDYFGFDAQASVTGVGTVTFSVSAIAAEGAVVAGVVQTFGGGASLPWPMPRPAARSIRGFGDMAIPSAIMLGRGTVTPQAIVGTCHVATSGPLVSSRGEQAIVGTGQFVVAARVEGNGTQTFVALPVHVSVQAPRIAARGSVEEPAYRPFAIVPDEIDTAWTTLQRNSAIDEEETLILLGVFDA